MLSKIKNSKFVKYISVTLAVAMVAAMGCFSCFATGEGEGSNLASTLQSSFASVQSDIFSYIGVILPVALAIVGAFFGIKKAISFFKSTAGK